MIAATRIIAACIALAALAAMLSSDHVVPPAAVPAPGLNEAARAFFEGMAATEPDANRAAMEAWVPTRDDFEELFPGHGDLLWATWEPEAKRLIEEAPSNADAYRAGLPFGGVVQVANLRREGSFLLKGTLQLIRRDVPVLGGMVATATGTRVASAVVWVRGRWVWIWQLERAAGLIQSKEKDD